MRGFVVTTTAAISIHFLVNHCGSWQPAIIDRAKNCQAPSAARIHPAGIFLIGIYNMHH